MNLLLDSCALIGLSNGNLSAASSRALGAGVPAFVCSVSVWEIAIKHQSGKVRLLSPPKDWFAALAQRYALQEIPLQQSTACAAAALPPLHKDPFDRVIVATALEHQLQILTSNQIIPTYPGVACLW